MGIQSSGSARRTLYKRRNLREAAILPPALLYHEVREARKPGVKGNAGRIQRNRRTSGERIPGKRKRERIP